MNENNEVVRYKARLVAQDFSYIPSVLILRRHSLMVDAIIL